MISPRPPREQRITLDHRQPTGVSGPGGVARQRGGPRVAFQPDAAPDLHRRGRHGRRMRMATMRRTSSGALPRTASTADPNHLPRLGRLELGVGQADQRQVSSSASWEAQLSQAPVTTQHTFGHIGAHGTLRIGSQPDPRRTWNAPPARDQVAQVVGQVRVVPADDAFEGELAVATQGNALAHEVIAQRVVELVGQGQRRHVGDVQHGAGHADRRRPCRP